MVTGCLVHLLSEQEVIVTMVVPTTSVSVATGAKVPG